MYEKLAERIGIPVEEVRAAMWELERKARGITRPMGVYRHRMETRLENKLLTLLHKQQDYVLKHLQALSIFKQKGIRVIQRKELINDLNDLMRNLPHRKDIAQQIYDHGALVTMKAGQRSVKDYGLAKLGIEWDLGHPAAVSFLRDMSYLHLSQRAGSIDATTQNAIRDIIMNGAQAGQTYTEMAGAIRALDETIFSRTRAQLIATNTLGKAYEFGNREPLREAHDRGNNVEKLWQTVEDDKVTEECAANEDEGWIPFEQAHKSGDQQPLRSGNPRCRCTELYRILERTGTEVNPADAEEAAPASRREDAPLQKPKAQQQPEVIVKELTLKDGNTIKSRTGYGYHAFDTKYMPDVLDKGLVPRLTFADQRFPGHPGDEIPKVYFAADEKLVGVGLDMHSSSSVARVGLNEFEVGKTFKDPHIPQPGNVVFDFYTEHGWPRELVQVKDENGKYVPILQYIKDHPKP
jgi:hypothetical protein